jgi:tRNA(His) 5'-end guanylyltransferase
MDCEQARIALEESRAFGGRSAKLDAHLASCAACSAFAARAAALDAKLSGIAPPVVSPDFDARFFARLTAEKTAEEARARRKHSAHVAWLLLPMAAAGLLWLRPARIEPQIAGQPSEELRLAAELDMVRDMEVVAKLDEIEAYDVLSEVDEPELTRLAQEKP